MKILDHMFRCVVAVLLAVGSGAAIAEADDAPRAHHIRNDVDTKLCALDGHRNFRS